MTERSPPMASPAPTYELVEADPVADAAAILRIWSGNFGPDHEHPAKFRHIHLENPYGRSLILLLRHVESGEYVGVIAAVPRPMMLDGRAIRAGVVSHFAVLPAHRSLGPALALQSGIATACEERFDLVYGMPNEKAAPIIKRAGYASIGSLGRHVKVLRYGEYAARILPRPLARLATPLIDGMTFPARRLRGLLPDGLAAIWSVQPSVEFDRLQDDAPFHTGLASVRSARFLAWRFSEQLGVKARYLQVRSGATLVAWFACEDNTATAGRITVIDYGFADLSAAQRRKCIRRLLSMVAGEGYGAIEILLSGARAADDGWHAEGFVERDKAPIVGKCYLAEPPPPANVHMTYLDQDS